MWLARPHIQSKHVWSMAEGGEGMNDGSPGTWLPLPDRAQDGTSLVCHQHTCSHSVTLFIHTNKTNLPGSQLHTQPLCVPN